MSVLDGNEVVYVARVPTKRIMAVDISVGTRFPAYATSMGRVLLASRSDEWLDAHLAATPLRALTPKTVTDPVRLRTLLGRVRAQGYAIVDEELEEGLRSVAVPVRDRTGDTVAAINMSTSTRRTTVELIRRELLPLLQETARTIEDDLRRG